MKGKLLLTITGFIVLFTLAACAPFSVPTANVPNDLHRTITAQGSGEVYLTPDIAYISIGVESRATQVNAALNENNAQAERISETLREMGVEDRDIQTSAFSIYPYQEYGPSGEPGELLYVVSNTVTITVRNLNTMGEMLDAVVEAGANAIHSIQFDVENKEQAITEARRLAISNAQLTATELADAAGIELGELVSLNVYSSGSPTPYYDGKVYGGMGATESSVPVAAGQMSIHMVADLAYEIK